MTGAPQAQPPAVAAGVDLLAGVPLIPVPFRGNDYRRAAFGESWDGDNSAPGGHNGGDTRFPGGFDVLDKVPQEVEFASGTFR